MDGELPTSLAVVRSLGGSGNICSVTANSRRGAYLSRFAYRKRLIDGLDLQTISDIVNNFNIEIVFPHYETTALWCFNNRNLLNNVQIASTNEDLLRFCVDKTNVLTFLLKSGIKGIPSTTFYGYNQLDSVLLDEITRTHKEFYLKAVDELDKPPGPFGRYVFVDEIILREKKQLISEFLLRNSRIMVQERIEGVGIGIGGLWIKGVPVCFGGHRRLMESDETGGASVLAESYLNQNALKLAREIMGILNWTGIAMVEFKLRKDGIPVFMEINPRIWGTMPLYVLAGADIPNAAVEFFLEGQESFRYSFKEGIKMKYTLSYLTSICKRHSFKEVIGGILNKDFLFSKDPSFDLDDLLPFLAESSKIVLAGCKAAAKSMVGR